MVNPRLIDTVDHHDTVGRVNTEIDALFSHQLLSSAAPVGRSNIHTGHRPALPDGFIYRPGWMSTSHAAQLFERLWGQIKWEQTTCRGWRKATPTPRLTAWFGDSVYRYSGTTNHPQAWLPALAEIRNRLEMDTGARYNSCLANRYDSGRVHRLGWHSDNESGLGEQPTIASLSLGASRDFRLRRKADHDDTYTLKLDAGDLLVMHGDSQAEWDHCVPARANVGPRLNLTFRWFN